MMPNRMDETAAPKAYAKPQMKELMTFSKFVNHIANHNGAFTRGTVRGVIVDMCECLVEMLLEGKKVEMGELGNFWISLSSEGAESLEKFSADNIKAVNIIFTPGTDFENLIGRAEFNVVSSRVAQIATLKAEKAGNGTVDLEGAKLAAKAGRVSNSDSKASTGGTADDSGSGDSGNTGAGSSDSGDSGSDNTGSDSGSDSGSTGSDSNDSGSTSGGLTDDNG